MKKIKYPLLISIIIVLVLGARQYMAGEQEKIDYLAEYNHITKPANYEPNNNAANLYQKAFDAYIEIPEELKDKNIFAPFSDFNDDEIKILRNWLERNSTCIDYFNQAVLKSYWWVELKTKNDGEIIFPELTPYRKVLRSAIWQVKLSAYDGGDADSIEQLFIYYTSSKHLSSPKSFVEQLVGLATKALAIKNIFSIINEQTDFAVLLKHKQNMLSRNKTNIEFSSGEFIYMLNAIQGCFKDNGKLNPSAFAKMSKDSVSYDGSSLRISYLKALLISFRQPNREKTITLAKEYHDYFNKLIEQTPWQLNQEGTTYTKSLSDFVKNNYVLNFGRQKTIGLVCELFHRQRILEESLLCTVALLEYKNRENKFPDKLEDLIEKEYIENLPIDPYSGEPLVYKKTEDDFTLYSIGADFKDEGGIHNDLWGSGKEGGDYVFWPVQL